MGFLRACRRGILAIGFLYFASAALGASHEVMLPLHDGRLRMADLSIALCKEAHVAQVNVPGTIDLNGARGARCLEAMNASLGDGCRVTIGDRVLILHVDTARLPHGCDEMKRVVRTFTAVANPEAAARQAKHWGLFLPATIDPGRPIVILIHGLDCQGGMLEPMADLLRKSGHQVGFFCYPDDEGIDESADFLAGKLMELHTAFPSMKIDLICHSMGGLVARDYIEGPSYRGGVDHLILVGSPNGGSGWAPYRFALEVQEQFNGWRYDPEWSWTWMITDGLGEAARDLKPHSAFLKKMDALPRRKGVRYTIIAGSQHPAARIGAGVVSNVAHWTPKRVSRWRGFRQINNGLNRWADHLSHKSGKSDGAVSIQSAKLAGVSDFVVLPADHCALFCPEGNHSPAAFPIIRDRLSK
jgi:pimeloyl-ACP methyl ester carboxylesterase